MKERKTAEISDPIVFSMDQHAFAHEYQRIYKRLWLHALGVVGNTQDADDIVQQSALTAFHRLHEFRAGSSLTAWLSEIVKRTAWNTRRKSTRRKTFATDPVDLEQQIGPSKPSRTQFTHELAAMDAEIDDDLYRVLRQMPEEARCCLLLRVIDGLSYSEISEMLGIPEGTAASHVHRAKSFARQRLSKRSREYNSNLQDKGGAR